MLNGRNYKFMPYPCVDTEGTLKFERRVENDVDGLNGEILAQI